MARIDASPESILRETELVDLPGKGDRASGLGGGLGVGVDHAGNNYELEEFDSSQPTGRAKVSPGTLFARRNAIITVTPGALDLAGKLHMVMQLASGQNSITGLTNAVNGTTYIIELIQPASGAPGTITVSATAPVTVKAAPLTLSPVNGASNVLFLDYNATTTPSTPYFLACVSQGMG